MCSEEASEGSDAGDGAAYGDVGGGMDLSGGLMGTVETGAGDVELVECGVRSQRLASQIPAKRWRMRFKGPPAVTVRRRLRCKTKIQSACVQ